MVSRSVVFILAVAFSAGPCLAQENDKKTPPTMDTDNEATVFFTNGSLVRMSVQQEHFEVATEFGKLTVPAHQVRRIEFGVHFPEGMEQQIVASIKKLNSSVFKERDAAVNDLVARGVYAYPLLRVAAKQKGIGPEAAQRIALALKRIQSKVPEKLLKRRAEDTIVTPKFTIVGHIVTPKIKAKAEHFGEVQLAVHGLRSISWHVAGGDTEVTVDAAKYAGMAQQQWLDSGFQVDGSNKLTILASGLIDQWPQGPGQYMCGPSGMNNGQFPPGARRLIVVNGKAVQAMGNYAPGALLGRIGETGAPFVLGERYEGTPEGEGKLYLQIVPSPWQCESTGSYKVKISTGPAD